MLILNRDFEVPADGFYQLAPIGEFPHETARIVQVIDRESSEAMAAMFAAEAAKESFAGVLIDFDHFSLDASQKSEAAGWITALDSRDTGLWAKIRWSDVGEEAVMGGRYRFLSPVWAREDCVVLGMAANGYERVRPIRLLNAAVTNDPNLKGILPLSNRAGGPCVDFSTSIEGRPYMKTVVDKLVNHLGLPSDATEGTILEKLRELPTLAAYAQLQNSVRDLQSKHDALVADVGRMEEDLVNRDLTDFVGIVTDATKPFWKEQLLANRASTVAVMTELKAASTTGTGLRRDESPGATRKPLHNRSTARPEQPSTGRQNKDTQAVRIRNRAHEISKAESVPFSVAFRRASREADEGNVSVEPSKGASHAESK